MPLHGAVTENGFSNIDGGADRVSLPGILFDPGYKVKVSTVPGLNEDQLVDEQRLFPPMPEAPGVTNGVKD